MNKKGSIFSFRLILFSTLVLFFFSHCEKLEPDTPPIQSIDQDSIISIKELRNMFQGEPVDFKNSGLNIFGTVVMDDSSGNIYREAFVQDDEAGIILRMTQSGDFTEGDSVRISLAGSILNDYRNMLQLTELDGSKNVVVLAKDKHPEPILLTIPEISTQHQGMLIKIENVQFSLPDAGKTYAYAEELNPENRNLEDCDGNSIIVRTSGYADFASELTPEGNGSIVSIVGEHDQRMQLVIRRTSEVTMDQERCEPPGSDLELITIAEIKEMYDNGVQYLPPNTRIEGIVISDREHENHPGQNAFIMDENNDGIALRFQAWHSLDKASNIRISSSGLPITRFNGLLQISEIPLGNVSVLSFGEIPEPSVVTIQDLNNNINLFESKLIKIENVSIPGGGAFAGNIEVQDGTGSIIMYTTNWASFANTSVTGGIYNITAIASIHHSPQILIRSLDDLELISEDDNGYDGEPVTFIDEDFQSYPNHDIINDYGWTAYAETGSRNWICRTFDNNHYAQATAFNSTDDSNIMWMITPAIDLEAMTNPILEFESAKAFFTHNGFSLHISTNFDGENVSDANWQTLDAILAGESDADNAWVHSGFIDLSSFSGIVHIAWRYQGAAPQGQTGTFRVDNVKLYEDD